MEHMRVAIMKSTAGVQTGASGGPFVSATAQTLRNKGWRGFKLTLNIKSISGGNLACSVNEYDDSGNIIKTWSTGNQSGAGITILEVHPALTTAGTVYNDILGFLFNTGFTLGAGVTATFDAVLDLVP